MNGAENITGRDDYIIAKALYLAAKWMHQQPIEEQSLSDADDMLPILEHRYPSYEGLLSGSGGAEAAALRTPSGCLP